MLVAATGNMQETKHPSLPMPRYIPAGFNLRSVLWNPQDGFGGGDNERAMIYVKGGPDRVTHRNLPLQVIVSTDIEHEFAYTEKADSIREIIYMDDGTELKGKYFDGEWVSMRDGTRY
jgi:Na+-transporting NADH:ubiquinone oxidoreductase subunit NqrF